MILIDLTPYVCPYPLVKVKLLLKQMDLDEKLHVLLSDPGSRRDVPLLIKKMGFGIEIIADQSHCLSFIITKTN
ncbi:MAG: sulfurtransferase TusA family protein [Shewanella psychromarinicola]|jgi:tRNA 2-thiouridine synthesizing protein A|uniref:Sulfurtransferase TusA family protein n=1 Tax=Shewanella psychromarinicola TaxID=2487742 RepID=A0A3N4EJJ5_9GAMM|nr:MULTISPECIES: sulfurtransferase TusA family protein [Shewanella]AZG36562.1 sulfurtransferase TusA family protein [Shewanella psychromarinicola]MCL1083079.1 sulfurtransferase TusA family protein [Shewanella psychromarinicola]PKG77791.1 response regulator SirA [Shewanella sp. Actino-trap-3]RPA34410.1 sulfurtransferase TusA family protein [Shewanella psychromarinicola]|tara:strand:+ start:82296 stop:82517 length:222 start_codon:yes stop_codon:yes gene_type:complete